MFSERLPASVYFIASINRVDVCRIIIIIIDLLAVFSWLTPGQIDSKAFGPLQPAVYE